MKFSELDPSKLSIEEKYTLIMNGVVDYSKEDVEENKVDFLVVLGCTPRPLKARVIKAAELYSKGYAKYILLSGGYGWNKKVEKNSKRDKELIQKARENIGDNFLDGESDEDIRELTESEMMAQMIAFFGIPEENIFYEAVSNNTVENIKCAKQVFRGLEERGEVDSVNSIMLVTSSFHCRRALLTFRRYLKGLEIVACPSTLDMGSVKLTRESMIENDYYRRQIENELDAIINYTRNNSIEDCDIEEFVDENTANEILKKHNLRDYDILDSI